VTAAIPDPPSRSLLGIDQLERLRSSLVWEAQHAPAASSAQEFALNKAVLDCLGVGLEPTHRFIRNEQPTLAELETWIVSEAGGTIDDRRLAHAKAIGDGRPPDARRVAELEELRNAPPSLSARDLAFWDEHGYVTVPAAAPRDACRELERAIWTHLGADPEKPDGWYRCRLQQGVMVQLFHAPGIAEIHASTRIQKAFAQLAGTVDLVMTTDRCGFNPPVRPGNPYTGARLHLDLASFEPPVSPELQGILYLTDTAEDQGALRLIPGFHKRIDSWLQSLPAGRDPTLEDLSELGPIRSIAASAGDLIIWSSALPHGPQANTADRPRIVHYLTMYPSPYRETW
jgi:hypothetical protein